MVSRREIAEDLLQEVFVKAFFALPSFQGESAFYTWLFRIASNHCLDHLRKRNLATLSLDAAVGEDEELSKLDSLVAPSTEDPEYGLQRRNETAGILDSLTADQRLILSLRELEGYSYDELATTLNCAANTVKSRLNRAREALRAAYEKRFGNISDADNVQNSGEIR